MAYWGRETSGACEPEIVSALYRGAQSSLVWLVMFGAVNTGHTVCIQHGSVDSDSARGVGLQEIVSYTLQKCCNGSEARGAGAACLVFLNIVEDLAFYHACFVLRD